VTSSGSCPLCQIAASREGVIFEDDTWLVRSTSSTPAVAGWLILQTRRHIGDPADFDANEAASFGSMLQRFAHLLREITGALRIYTGSLNEGSPHFHRHLLPRLPVMPNDAIGWDAFGLSDLARRGDVRADPAEVARVLAAVRERSTSSV